MKPQAKATRRQSFTLPREYVVMFESLLAQGLASNEPIRSGLKALTERLQLKGAYAVRLSATLEPVEVPSSNGVPSDQ